MGPTGSMVVYARHAPEWSGVNLTPTREDEVTVREEQEERTSPGRFPSTIGRPALHCSIKMKVAVERPIIGHCLAVAPPHGENENSALWLSCCVVYCNTGIQNFSPPTLERQQDTALANKDMFQPHSLPQICEMVTIAAQCCSPAFRRLRTEEILDNSMTTLQPSNFTFRPYACTVDFRHYNHSL
ncbi:hypothetical protein J6590_062237 [Homalodisca vitripennis]|nr:hypothetical protein J6590_062237 [Homalodisca vitripennis]